MYPLAISADYVSSPRTLSSGKDEVLGCSQFSIDLERLRQSLHIEDDGRRHMVRRSW